MSNYYYGPYANPGVIAVNRTGRYVRVQLAGSQYLVMGELQVWGGSTGQVGTRSAGVLASNERSERASPKFQ